MIGNNLKRGYDLFRAEYEAKALEVLRSGWYVLGKEVEAFEREFAAYLCARHCVGLGSGLDALTLAFRVLGVGPGDEVVVAANAYIASVMGITKNGAAPVFVEPDEDYGISPVAFEKAISFKTKAVLPVHLYGGACDMGRIVETAKERGLFIVEDCAQAHGTTWGGQPVGTFGDVGCFSFYPTKGLGAFGDGGAVTAADGALAARFQTLRNYGSSHKYVFDEVGENSRLDELQAGLLRVKLAHLDTLNAERRTLARRYLQGIRNSKVRLPADSPGHTWHQFVVRARDRNGLAAHLAGRGIGTEIHYPIPPHLSKAYAYLGHGVGDFPVAEQMAQEVLSLPLFNGMTEVEQAQVIEGVNTW
jgi:dTDP-4-amino-4,6-dideoxygalactose transaminase